MRNAYGGQGPESEGKINFGLQVMKPGGITGILQMDFGRQSPARQQD